MSSSITIITAFFDIGRGNWSYNYPRSEQEYINYFENLATLENEMVIFTSKKFKDKIKQIRSGYPTTIIEINFNKKFAHTIKKIQSILDSDQYKQLIPQELHNNPEYRSAEYVLVNNLKYYFVKQAIQNLKKAQEEDLFAWVDFGFCRKTSTTNGIKKWSHNFNPNYIHLFTLKEPFIIEDETSMLKKALNNENYLIGGMIVGSKYTWLELYPKISNIQKYYLNKNISDDDQGTMLMTLCEYPSLFKVHYLKKGWFCGFKQFNKGSTYKNIFYKLKSLLKI